ncbi:FAD-dependent oxidoreductase [Paenibacillus mendelii]|uniref:FAD-dependent oxidoreductase n=1 Tax=Paenibacillus mendelii TaxID=206163 RepID=A0ABV6JA42_9BACL|nr:FAD-dependent oxidoreductase [Paenibacillus mendelii]MCQ6562099.1 FAD-dependent oxidoreductase [Paenibacillus mendelii]
MADTNPGKLQLPQMPQSYWRESVKLPSYPKLEKDIEVDVVIIGGGITGISTAYLLSKQGLRIAILEADVILNGTTGHTTAKITAQHDLIYDEFIGTLGEENARLYYEANRDALQFVKQTVSEHRIECDFSEEDAYVYAQWDSTAEKVHKEAAAYAKLGIDGGFVDKIPLAVPSVGAVIMRNQAKFNPLQYLTALLPIITAADGVIYERTTAIDVEEGATPVVITREGWRVKAGQVVVCSHFPFIDRHGLYFARLHAERSYVLAATMKDSYPGGMYLSADNPKRSIRSVGTAAGEQLILIGGENHKTGQGICTIDYYESLLGFAMRQFKVESFPYRWSAQDLITLDKVPYIGPITSGMPNIFIATGYAKWGMSNSTAAAMIISDTIAGRDNPYRELYSPQRFHPNPSIKNAITQNFDVAKQLISGKLENVNKKAEQLQPGEGAVVTLNGKRAGAYLDDQGKLHLVDTTCTHMGCEVEWNNGDRSWDCPCHGSRFNYEGEVMEGPAKQPLTKLSGE